MPPQSYSWLYLDHYNRFTAEMADGRLHSFSVATFWIAFVAVRTLCLCLLSSVITFAMMGFGAQVSSFLALYAASVLVGLLLPLVSVCATALSLDASVGMRW